MSGSKKAARAQRTSEVELPLLEGVELGGDGLEELGGELWHGGWTRTTAESESGGPRARVARNHNSDAPHTWTCLCLCSP